MKRLTFTLTLALAAILTAAAGGNRSAKPTLSILGDSYSTFEGYIPAGNAVWYHAKPDTKATDVASVRQTWWWQLIDEGGYKLGVNESYSGATVSYTGYAGEDYSDRSFITRLPNLGSPDLILIFGATNDYWCGAPLGDYVYDNLTRGHLYEFRPALGRLLSEAQNRYPGSRIVFMINTDLKPEIVESITTICRHYGVEYLQLKDIDKHYGHPTIEGMTAIKEQTLRYLDK